MMDWQECEKEFIREAEIDHSRIKSIIDRALQRKKVVDSIVIDETTVSFVIEGYYEVIKEMLVAYLLKNGLRSKNHQCLISYFYLKNPQCESEANLISRMSYYRNRLNYYGETIPLRFYSKNKEDILEIIALLKNIINSFP